MRYLVLAAVLLPLAAHVRAAEPTACPGPGTAILAARPAPHITLAVSDGLLVAREARGAALLLWAEEPASYISPDFGALLIFADGTECSVAVPAGQARGVRVPPSTSLARAVAIEAGLCSRTGDGCLPVRFEMPQRR
jgi:hypothetical protein